MNTAVFCLTPGGYQLAVRVKNKLEADGDRVRIYAPAKRFIAGGGVETFDSLAPAVETAFLACRRIVFIMALGIVVRMIAPHIRDKSADPAVVVMDETGQHVISALSGHQGGANALARRIAALTGARPVITTATDLHGLPAVDELARIYNLVMDPPAAARVINGALVDGKSVGFYASGSMLPKLLPSGVQFKPVADYPDWRNEADYNVVVTNRLLEESNDNTVFLRPRNLVAGVGCRAGMSESSILTALRSALEHGRLSMLSLRILATIECKADEPGLKGAAIRLGLPLATFSPAGINAFMERAGHQLARSHFVQEKVGAPAVCEPAALLASVRGELILPKQKFGGITVAVARDG
ncbi:MAG: cobalt-precorrin 5A hydrolase [Firmicutes bacterium]|nr:cobalt-precorrin 5A hydrolase [Bacillota bacterium]